MKQWIHDLPSVKWGRGKYSQSYQDVLIRQHYGGESDWKTHFHYLLPFFRDHRYITHEGQPMFLVYRPAAFPEISRMLDCWDRRPTRSQHATAGDTPTDLDSVRWPDSPQE